MDKTLHYRLMGIQTIFHRTFLRGLRAYYPDLSPGQPKVIEYLFHRGSAFQREIAAGCFLEPPTLSLILDKMEKQGLIYREKKPENRKNLVVSLTDYGLEVGRRQLEVFRQTEDRFCCGLTPEERGVLSSLLEKLYQNGLQVKNEISAE